MAIASKKKRQRIGHILGVENIVCSDTFHMSILSRGLQAMMRSLI
ncbi:MAG: hypothetical protein AAGI69_19370 [Cyanobacteria bacterium P01_H01_bin.21]